MIKTEELDKTDNNMIFVERDKPLSEIEIAQKLQILMGLSSPIATVWLKKPLWRLCLHIAAQRKSTRIL